MLAALLLTWLAKEPSAPRIQDQGRVPILSEQEESRRRLREMPLSELLAAQPPNARIKRDGQWIDSPEVLEMRRRVDADLLSADDWRTALVAADLIHVRPRWPAGMPLQLGIGGAPWLPLSWITVRAVEPDLGEVSFDDREPTHCGTCNELRRERARNLELGMLPEGTKRVVFEVTVVQRESSEKPRTREKKDRRLWQGRLERQIEAVASVADVLPPSTRPEDTDAIRSRLMAVWSRAPEESDQLVVFLYARYDEVPALRNLGVSLTVELWNGAQRIGSGDLVVRSRRTFTDAFDDCAGNVGLKGMPKEMRAEGFEATGWELRVRANPAGVPGIWDADRWWNGSLAIPLADALEKAK